MAWGELLMLHLETRKDLPYRFVLVPNAMYLLRKRASAAEAERAASRMLWRSTDRVRIVKHVKYYADGAMYSQLMQMSEPYLDGHHGEWMMSPTEQAAVLDAFWRKGWAIHVHVNGDAGLDRVLDQIEQLRRSHPAPGRRAAGSLAGKGMEVYGRSRPSRSGALAASGEPTPYLEG